MLLGKHCCGSQHRHLFTGRNRLEDGPDRYLGFAEAHIAANQAIHRLRLLHIPLHIDCGLELIRGWFIGE
ncbi:MAG: Uncharacterised protein [Synechococcus sp. MIT S9220]|nr:MAG: Uncharacterised protein [Synechococcus sp. MIT S9220]